MRLGIARKIVVLAALVAGLLIHPGLQQHGSAADDTERPIVASNAIVVDADTGRVLYEHGMDEQVAPASLTKIFTAIVALETAALESDMDVDEYDLVGEASIGLVAGETLTMETLLHGLMLTSGNDAAMTISRELGYLPGDSPQESVSRFVDRVNATAERIGLTNTTLRNPHGLDQNGHKSTAADIAAMTMYALDNPVFRELISTPYYAFNGREFYNANQFLDVYPGLIGGKTGITTDAGHCLMQVATRGDNTVVVVLLGSTGNDWYADAEYLLDLGFEALEKNPEDDTRPVIGMGGSVGFEAPEVAPGTSVGGNFTVDRVSDNEAIIRPNNPVSAEDSASWRWPLVSIGMMGVALVMVLHFPSIVGMGALVIDRGSRVRFAIPSVPSIPRRRKWFSRPRRGSGHQQPSGSSAGTSKLSQRSVQPGSRRFGTPRGEELMNQTPYQTAVSVSPARSRAENAIKLAMQGRYHVATEEFRMALQRDPDVDITSCPGFWRMQPMGYIAAAKAYAMNNQTDEARRLLTVVQLAFKQNHELVRLFGRAIKTLEP